MQDALLKKHQDELNGKKLKLSMMQKKEGGNLTVRDFTDDIYTKGNLVKNHFVEGMMQGSDLFTNMLIVCQKNKFAQLNTDLAILMRDYYENLDSVEFKRITDHAKIRLHEMRENQGLDMEEFIKKHELMGEHDETWEKRALDAAHKLLEGELKVKQQNRMPFVIVPDYPMDLTIDDKDQNNVYRVVVYKAQADDVMKALRRKGYTSRTFTYDKPTWERENQERGILKEEVANLTQTLMRAATGSFQQLFVALMHLKVVRVYIDGVLRFGIPPKFYIGIVMPKKGAEKAILTDMCAVLAEESMKEMYGEKQDANDNEDYWPFVCVNLTSPNFMHVQKE